MRKTFFSLVIAVLLLASVCAPAHAAINISNVSFTNLSPPDAVIANGNSKVQEFRTENISLSPVISNGVVASFDNHFGFMMSHRVDQPAAPNFALIYLRVVGYSLTFTVEDPNNEGYSIHVDHSARGYITVSREEEVQVSTGSSLMLGRFDDGNGAVLYNSLNFSGGGLNLRPGGASFADRLAGFDKSFTIPTSYAGTRTFTLSFNSAPSPAVNSIFQNFGGGETSVRYGLEPTHTSNGDSTRPDFLYASYSQPGSEPIGDHGHFVTVTVTSLNPTPADADDDGVPDDEDNCPNTPNPGQEDSDDDGIGDVCDNCVEVFNPDQLDSDNDGIGDECEILEVLFDVKPGAGSTASCKQAKGVIPSAFYGSDEFDVTEIDINSLSINDVSVTEKHGTMHLEDVNEDGYTDAVLHLNASEFCNATEDIPAKQDSFVTIWGLLLDGIQKIMGTSDVKIIK